MKLLKILGVIFVGIIAAGVFDNLKRKNSEPQTAVMASQQTVNEKLNPKPKSAAESYQARKTEQAKKDLSELMSYPKLGKSHEVGNLNITVNNINQGKYVGSDTANGMYWMVSVTIRNDGSDPQTIDDSMFQIISPTNTDATESAYDPDVDADIQANLNNHFLSSTLNPGVSTDGFVIFDMPTKYTAEQMQAFHLFVNTGFLGAKQSFSFLS